MNFSFVKVSVASKLSVRLHLNEKAGTMKGFAIIFVWFLNLKLSRALELKCTFVSLEDGMNCKMQNNITAVDLPVTTIVGNRTAKEVRTTKVLFVSAESSTSYLPTHSCSHFVSLKKFEVESKYLKEISRSVFSECTKVDSVNIYSSMLARLPEDVFADLTNLAFVLMKNNKLSFLPTDLFKENQKLVDVNFDGNRLTVVNTVMPDSVTKLSMKMNICTKSKSPGVPSTDEDIKLVIKNLNENCRDLGLARQTTQLEEQIKALEDDITKLKSDNDKTLQKPETNLLATVTQQQNCEIKTARLETDIARMQRSNQLINEELERAHAIDSCNISQHDGNQEKLVSNDHDSDKFVISLLGILIAVLALGWFATTILYWRSKRISYRIPDYAYTHRLSIMEDEKISD